MFKTKLPLILVFACAFSLHVQAHAQAALENEIEQFEEVESQVPDESRVKDQPRVNRDEPKRETPSESTTKRENPGTPVQSQRTNDGGGPRTRLNEGEESREKAPSSSGEMIFDWSKHQGETEVKHPFAEKGLIRITKDKTYIYKVKTTEATGGMSLQVGVLDPQNLRNPDADVGSPNSTFKENYGQSGNPTILVTREWDGWVGALGKINYRVGSGLFVAQGHGHFTGADNVEKEPMENFTFLAFPTSGGLVYRLQFSDQPLLVPFVEGGVTGWLMTEIRDDNKSPKFGITASAYGAGGVAVNMQYFSYLSRIHMNHQYGITGVFFTLEYRRMQALMTRYDFSGNYINGGFLMHY